MADKLTFQDGLETWKYPGTRQGRPKNTWANQALKEVWQRVRIDSEFGHREFKGDDKDIERESLGNGREKGKCDAKFGLRRGIVGNKGYTGWNPDNPDSEWIRYIIP